MKEERRKGPRNVAVSDGAQPTSFIQRYSVLWLVLTFLFLAFFATYFSLLKDSSCPDQTITLDSNTEPQSEKAASDDLPEQHYENCMLQSRKIAEPYIEAYKRRRLDLDKSMLSYYKWNKPIAKEDLELQKTTNPTGDCRLVFKIKGRDLFVYQKNDCYAKVSAEKWSAQKERYECIAEMILLTLEVYDLPDTDFALELEDTDPGIEGVNRTLPVMTFALSAEEPDTNGFTFPSYGAYVNALGYRQVMFFRDCLDDRYPRTERIAKAVWRGASTGAVFRTAQDVVLNGRVKLAQLGMNNTEFLDVGIVDYVQFEKNNSEVLEAFQKLAPLQNRLALEDFNLYKAVIDVDGNAWSDRLPRLLMSTTPVLKQEYVIWKDFYGHLLENGTHVIYFKEDLSDLPEIAERLMKNGDTEQYESDMMVNSALGFVLDHLSHHGVMKAMAYAIAKYSSFLSYKVEMEPDFIQIPRNTCCHHNPSLPAELISKMRS